MSTPPRTPPMPPDQEEDSGAYGSAPDTGDGSPNTPGQLLEQLQFNFPPTILSPPESSHSTGQGISSSTGSGRASRASSITPPNTARLFGQIGAETPLTKLPSSLPQLAVNRDDRPPGFWDAESGRFIPILEGYHYEPAGLVSQSPAILERHSRHSPSSTSGTRSRPRPRRRVPHSLSDSDSSSDSSISPGRRRRGRSLEPSGSRSSSRSSSRRHYEPVIVPVSYGPIHLPRGPIAQSRSSPGPEACRRRSRSPSQRSPTRHSDFISPPEPQSYLPPPILIPSESFGHSAISPDHNRRERHIRSLSYSPPSPLFVQNIPIISKSESSRRFSSPPELDWPSTTGLNVPGGRHGKSSSYSPPPPFPPTVFIQKTPTLAPTVSESSKRFSTSPDHERQDHSFSGLSRPSTTGLNVPVDMLDENDVARNHKTGTFVIYSPEDIGPIMPLDSLEASDLPSIRANLGVGGCLVSTHEPTEATSWLEANWDKSPVALILHSASWGGPFAWMLSPEEPALVIFGSYKDPVLVDAAQSLANSSGFPVVVRPADDNPALTLLTCDTDSQHGSVHLNNTGSNNDKMERNREFDESDEPVPEDQHAAGENNDGRGDDHNDASLDGEALNTVEECPLNGGGGAQGDGGGSGGGGDGGGDSTTSASKWESPLHRTRVKLQLKLSNTHVYPVTIGSTSKFTINRDTEIPIDIDDLTSPLTRPEVVALIDLKIETRPRETQVDRSYASIGFVAHRRESIFQREFLHRGFDLPDKMYKHGQQREIQRGFKAVLGFPDATAGFSYNQSKNFALEATDSKVMPKCRVDYEIGDEWDSSSESYSSYNISYELQDMRLDAERAGSHPLEVRVGMGINLRPAGSEQPLPQMSFVHRNQVLIWVSDPTSKMRIRGIMVLMSSYLDNIKTEERLSIYEQERIELSQGYLSVPETKEETHKPGTISLSIAHVQQQGAPGSNKLRAAVPTFVTKLGRRSAVGKSTYITPHEYLARGWDANNNEWRSVLWPALDKNFRAADLEGVSPVWKVQCRWKKDSTMAGATVQLQGEDNRTV
ncbi:hypothetical protein B0H14DRAFT_2694749 [Mycena olivaceomarginata]|nr:hypothetical protein B0H14DRAFT_2694749 [Mycena olivaceomarginata]